MIFVVYLRYGYFSVQLCINYRRITKMKLSKQKALKISLLVTDMFFCILIVFTVALPFMVTWYVETMHRSQSLPATVLVTCYPCVPFAAAALLLLRRLIKAVSEKGIFSEAVTDCLWKITVCCIVISVITLIAGKFYFPFLIVGATFAFLALLVFSFRSILSDDGENLIK